MQAPMLVDATTRSVSHGVFANDAGGVVRLKRVQRRLLRDKAPRTNGVLAVGLLCLFAFLVVGCSTSAHAQEVPPNILFILTDDQDPASLAYMPQTQALLVARGTTFEHGFATTPACCPSRASILRGQYVHNHGVWYNDGPAGGYAGFQKRNLGQSTVATWLDDAGYETAFMGKYLNHYGGGSDDFASAIPQGWDRWWGRTSGVRDNPYVINNNGRREAHDRNRLHEDDYLSRTAEDFMRNRANSTTPWFIMIASQTPHAPAWVAKRHKGTLEDLQMPRVPSFNEVDVSDKPRWVRRLPHVGVRGEKRAENNWRGRIRALQSVDDMVANLVATLEETGQLQNTYIVFTSDNGYLTKLHRHTGKGAPYEESQGVPFVVRGPGVPIGETRSELVANIDLAPTFAEWAGAQVPSFVDGRSFAQLLLGTETPWRKRLLFESRGNRDYDAVRTASGEVYIEYGSGEGEYYNLTADQYQLENTYPMLTDAQKAEFSARLDALRDCASDSYSCQAAEDAP